MRKITDESLQKYEKLLRDEEKSLYTIEKYVRDVRAFKLWSNDEKITKQLVLEYKQDLLKKYAPTSVNSMISSLNNYFEYVGWQEFRTKVLKIQKQIFIDKENELTLHEYQKLLSVSEMKKNKQIYYILQTICSTGIRVSELQYITVQALKRGYATINSKGKYRTIFLPQQLCEMLLDFAKKENNQNGVVFVSKYGNPINRSNVWSDMKKLCSEAGVAPGKVYPHNLRHLFARTYYFKYKDLVRLADVLGHSNINTTRIYTAESGEAHRMQIQKLGLLCKKKSTT